MATPAVPLTAPKTARYRVREPQDEEHEADGGGREPPLVTEQREEREDHALGQQPTQRNDPTGPDARVASDVGKRGAGAGARLGGGAHGHSNADHQGYCDADGAPDEGRTIPPQLSHETAEERSNPDRAVVRRRVPREGVPGPANPTHVGVAP